MKSLTPRKKDTSSPLASWSEVFALDFRSLAVFRVCAGLIILADLAFRLPTLVEMYTDEGCITRGVMQDYFQFFIGDNWEFGVWSFHWLSGSVELQYCLFGLAAIFAVALILGWHTRIATVGSWLLIASLHVRNPLILTSGDTILKLMLFWSMFLPLGRIWSLDAKRNANLKLNNGQAHSSVASACLILQLILMYFFTGIAKCNADWFSGNAMEFVMRLNIYLLPFGESMRAYPFILTVATYLTLFVEVVTIWWLLSPARNGLMRILLLLVFCGFHVGIGLSMSIGLFPLICIIVWIPLVPSVLWNRFASTVDDSADGYPPAIAQRPRTMLNCLVGVFLGFLILFTLLLNIANIENPVCKKVLPRFVAPVGLWLNLDQRFQMFGQPPKDNPWFVYEAQLLDGRYVDLMQGIVSLTDERLDLHKRPANLRLNLPYHHWRKLHRNLVNEHRQRFREPLLDFAVRNWNRTHEEDQQVAHARLFCYLEPTHWEASENDVVSVVWANYKNESQKALDSKINKALDQLLDDENPDLPGF